MRGQKRWAVVGIVLSAGLALAQTPAAVPAGTEIDVRLSAPLGSATARLDQPFEGVTLRDVAVQGQVVVPAGSPVAGYVSSMRAADRVNRRGTLTLAFESIVIQGRRTRLRGVVLQALDPAMSDGNALLNAVATASGIATIPDRARESLTGIAIDAGGTIVSAEGGDVTMPLGTVLRVRTSQPIDLTGR